jgi:hypothetical protein
MAANKLASLTRYCRGTGTEDDLFGMDPILRASTESLEGLFKDGDHAPTSLKILHKMFSLKPVSWIACLPCSGADDVIG